MKYMMLIYAEEAEMEMSPEAMAPWIKFGEDAGKLAKEHGAEALMPSATAKVVSVRNGQTVTTDGPFPETKEQLGGFYIYDCDNLDTAIKIAAMIPLAPTGHIEVRPIIDFGEMPSG